MRVLITGGAGFIGSHVADAMLAAGHEVAVLDSLASGSRKNVNPAARFYELDVRDREGMLRTLQDFRPDVVDHHAAQAEVPRSVKEPVYDAEVNLLGGINLLMASLDTGVRKLIFASTGGALYGEPELLPCPEDHPIRPLSPYGTSKYCFEQYLGTFQRTFGLDYTVLRYANIYGPRQDFQSEEGRVIAIFASRMIADQPVRIDGTGEQSRDLLYVSDAAAANLVALESGSAQAYNIGTGVEVSVNDVFRRLKELTGYQRKPEFGPSRPGDVFRIALDPTKAANDLGWTERVPLEDGLRHTVEYLRTRPELLTA